MTFLPNPAEIRKCLVEGLGEAESLDAAVAFVGRDWADLIGTFSGPVRIACWLSSSNTNPFAVEQMMGKENICVLQLPDMHAKVYILKGDAVRCIVGSANLTSAALSEENASGQYEAAICVADTERARAIQRWFKELWREADPISQSDLEAAKARWKAARPNSKKSARTNASLGASQALGSALPADWKPSDDLVKLAEEVRDEDFAFVEKYEDVLLRVVRNGRRSDVQALIRFVVETAGREYAFQPALNESPARIRQAFKVLFDHARNIESRLQDLDAQGPCKISGFALRSLTMILHWRWPTEYLPYNGRTQRFLQDFGLERHFPRTLSPVQYEKWLAFAQELSARLKLPSAGHVDRLVFNHTEFLKKD